jgi:hypothetical protein
MKLEGVSIEGIPLSGSPREYLTLLQAAARREVKSRVITEFWIREWIRAKLKPGGKGGRESEREAFLEAMEMFVKNRELEGRPLPDDLIALVACASCARHAAIDAHREEMVNLVKTPEGQQMNLPTFFRKQEEMWIDEQLRVPRGELARHIGQLTEKRYITDKQRRHELDEKAREKKDHESQDRSFAAFRSGRARGPKKDERNVWLDRLPEIVSSLIDQKIDTPSSREISRGYRQDARHARVPVRQLERVLRVLVDSHRVKTMIEQEYIRAERYIRSEAARYPEDVRSRYLQVRLREAHEGGPSNWQTWLGPLPNESWHKNISFGYMMVKEEYGKVGVATGDPELRAVIGKFIEKPKLRDYLNRRHLKLLDLKLTGILEYLNQGHLKLLGYEVARVRNYLISHPMLVDLSVPELFDNLVYRAEIIDLKLLEVRAYLLDHPELMGLNRASA